MKWTLVGSRMLITHVLAVTATSFDIFWNIMLICDHWESVGLNEHSFRSCYELMMLKIWIDKDDNHHAKSNHSFRQSPNVDTCLLSLPVDERAPLDLVFHSLSIVVAIFLLHERACKSHSAERLATAASQR